MSITGNAGTKNLFSFLRNVKAPTPGQLRDPVTFIKSKRVPTIGPNGEITDEFDQKITPFHDAFVSVWQNQTATLDGQNTENFVSHVLLMRNFQGLELEVRDYAIWDGKMLSVRGTRNLEDDPRKLWILVLCEQEGLFADEPRDNTATPEDAANEPIPVDPKNPLWI